MSLHYFPKKEGTNKGETLNNYGYIFSKYNDSSPTLSEALKQMFKSQNLKDEKVEELTDNILVECENYINDNFDKIKNKYDEISEDDAKIICIYTLESKEKEYSPYRILNENLVSKNRKNGVENISKYLYLFLKALRKLPKYKPNEENKNLYRCIRGKVKVSKDENNPLYIPYIKGNEKIFWGFTSTARVPNYDFLDGDNIKSGTLFRLTGKDEMWGYDIGVFNKFEKDEIILEPETKFFIEEALPVLNGIIEITCKIIKTPLILGFINQNKKKDNTKPFSFLFHSVEISPVKFRDLILNNRNNIGNSNIYNAGNNNNRNRKPDFNIQKGQMNPHIYKKRNKELKESRCSSCITIHNNIKEKWVKNDEDLAKKLQYKYDEEYAKEEQKKENLKIRNYLNFLP